MDALNSVIAAIYFQKQLNRKWHPIIYYLKIIINAKLNYHIYDKEILAIFLVFNISVYS